MNPSSVGTARSGLAVTVAALAIAAGGAWLVGPGTPDRRQAVVFAAGICLLGSFGAWAVGLRPAATAAGRAARPLAAMALRLGPALAALGWLQAEGSRLRAAGAGELLVVFYLAALGADITRIMIGGRNSGPRPRGEGGV